MHITNTKKISPHIVYSPEPSPSRHALSDKTEAGFLAVGLILQVVGLLAVILGRCCF